MTRFRPTHVVWSLVACSLFASPVMAQRDRSGGSSRGDDGDGRREGGIPTQYHFGMLHTPSIGTVLSTDVDGRLRVDPDVGQSTASVAITTSDPVPAGGEAPDLHAAVLFGTPGGLPVGSSFTIQPRDSFGNPVLSMLLSGTPNGDAHVTLDSPLCPACPVTVELLLDGDVVRSGVFTQASFSATGAIASNGGNGVEVRASRRSSGQHSYMFRLEVRMASATPITLSDGLPPVDCDAMRVSLNGLPPGTRYIGNLAMFSSNLPGFAIAREALASNEAVHVAQGQAHMRGVGDLDGDGFADLAFDNLGSSGQDGVRILRKMIPVTTPDITGEAISVQCDLGDSMSPGSVARYVADFPPGGGLGPHQRTMIITAAGGGQAALSLERCAPCGEHAVVVEAIHRGIVVDSVSWTSPPAGALAMCRIGAAGSGPSTLSVYRQPTLDPSGVERDSLGFECRSPEAGPCTLTGSLTGPVTADRVRMRLLPASGFVSEIRSAAVLTIDMPALTTSGARLRIKDLEAQLPAMGILARSMGDSIVSVQPDGSLSVRDCDDDGDGVELDYGDYTAVTGTLTPGSGGGGGAGGSYTLTYGAKAGKSGKTKFFDDGEDEGGGLPNDIGYESFICPTCPVQVDLLEGGAVVASQTYLPPLPPSVASRSFRFNKIKFKVPPRGAELTFDSSVATTLHNGPTAVASCMRITVLGAPAGPDADLIDRVEITASPGSSFSVSDAGFSRIPAGFVVRNGSGQLAGKKREIPPPPGGGVSPPDSALVVSNIGSSGQDGVSLHSGDEDCDDTDDPADDLSVSLQNVTVPDASRVAIKSKGLCHRIASVSLLPFEFLCQIDGTGGTHEVTADFSASGAPTCRVEVRLGGVLQGFADNQSGPFMARAFVTGHTIESMGTSRSFDDTTLVWSPRSNIRWSAPLPIELPSGAGFVGDELVVTGENPAYAIAGMIELAVTGADLPGGQMIILDHQVQPASRCLADVALPHNAAVDTDDLLALLGSWGPCLNCAGCPADIAPEVHNCAVDTDDLLAMLGSWGACP